MHNSFIPWLLNLDIPQVERLAGLDGEFLVHWWLVRLSSKQLIGDAIGRAGDQSGEYDPSLAIGRWLFQIIDRIDPGQGIHIGEQTIRIRRIATCPRCSGCDDHRNQSWSSVARDRLTIGVNQSPVGCAA